MTFIAGMLTGAIGIIATLGHFVLRPLAWRQGYDAAKRGEKRW